MLKIVLPETIFAVLNATTFSRKGSLIQTNIPDNPI